MQGEGIEISKTELREGGKGLLVQKGGKARFLHECTVIVRWTLDYGICEDKECLFSFN